VTRITFGIAGTGRMAAQMMEAFRHMPEIEVCAVCSNAPGRAQRFASDHNIARPYSGLEAMLADSAVNAVYIANATRDHGASAIAALKAGKHVLAEKPFAMNAREGEEVIAAAAGSGMLFMEGIWTLCTPAYQRIFSLVKANAAGEAVHFYTDFGYPADPAALPRLFEKEGGGVLLDRAVYPIALALAIFGAIETLHAQVMRDENGVDIHATIQARHANGVISQFSASMISMLSNTAAIACRDGVISLPAPVLGAEAVSIVRYAAGAPDDGGMAAKLKGALKKIPALRKLNAAFGAGAEPHPYGANQYLPQLQHFVELIAAQKTQSDIVSHDLSLAVIKTIDRIRAAA